MKKLKYIFSVVALGAVMVSCSTTIPYAVTNNPIGDKTGVSKSIVLGMAGEDHTGAASLGTGVVLNGNYGVIEAAKKGGIERIATVDLKTTNYLLFKKAEVIVTGE